MTLSERLVLLLFMLLSVSVVTAQKVSISTEKVYGYDPLLYNGRYYTFLPPLNTGGNQYFTGQQFENGSVTIRGISYSDLAINYDLYNQQLILKYRNRLGASTLIIVSDAWLESFSFRNMRFEVIAAQDSLKKIFQVLGNGPIKILYYWGKKLNLDDFLGAKNFVFTAPIKEMNLFFGGRILKYRNNRTFNSLFDPEKRTSVREYLNKNKVNVKKADDHTMTELIYFCNSI
jgi:hypothetical protein